MASDLNFPLISPRDECLSIYTYRHNSQSNTHRAMARRSKQRDPFRITKASLIDNELRIWIATSILSPSIFKLWYLSSCWPAWSLFLFIFTMVLRKDELEVQLKDEHQLIRDGKLRDDSPVCPAPISNTSTKLLRSYNMPRNAVLEAALVCIKLDSWLSNCCSLTWVTISKSFARLVALGIWKDAMKALRQASTSMLGMHLIIRLSYWWVYRSEYERRMLLLFNANAL